MATDTSDFEDIFIESSNESSETAQLPIVPPPTPPKEPEKKENEENATIGEKVNSFSSRVKELLNVSKEKEDPYETIEQIRKDSNFFGSKLWILIGAVLVASLGLNVNSTAVIIGAMLISPLMGPIIGFGTALGIYDFELLKRSLRNLALTTLFSILTAMLYFLVTPIADNGSELLSRTSPSIYDVLIAFVGGLLGMLAVSTKHKGQVLPGVAIATALMPPLCTAGYGLATMQWNFFYGAFYLYLINSVFIAFATYLVVVFLKFPQKVFVDPKRKIRVKTIMFIVALGTIVPSIYLSIGMIRHNISLQKADEYIQSEFNFADAEVVKHKTYEKDGFWHVDVSMVGKQLSPKVISSLNKKLIDYLPGAVLSINQGFQEETDLGQLRNDVLKDLYEKSDEIILRQRLTIDSLQQILKTYDHFGKMEKDIIAEIQALYPKVEDGFIVSNFNHNKEQDSVFRLVIKPYPQDSLHKEELDRMSKWIKSRTKTKKVMIVIDKSN